MYRPCFLRYWQFPEICVFIGTSIISSEKCKQILWRERCHKIIGALMNSWRDLPFIDFGTLLLSNHAFDEYFAKLILLNNLLSFPQVNFNNIGWQGKFSEIAVKIAQNTGNISLKKWLDVRPSSFFKWKLNSCQCSACGSVCVQEIYLDKS